MTDDPKLGALEAAEKSAVDAFVSGVQANQDRPSLQLVAEVAYRRKYMLDAVRRTEAYRRQSLRDEGIVLAAWNNEVSPYDITSAIAEAREATS